MSTSSDQIQDSIMLTNVEEKDSDESDVMSIYEVENIGNSKDRRTDDDIMSTDSGNADIYAALSKEREEIARLQNELAMEKNRMEKERLDSQRQLLAMERAMFEAQKNNSMQEAFIQLSETLRQMQDMMSQNAGGRADSAGGKESGNKEE